MKIMILLMKLMILLMKLMILLMKLMILLMKLMILLMKLMILLMKLVILLDFLEFAAIRDKTDLRGFQILRVCVGGEVCVAAIFNRLVYLQR
ncbi:hypothetical protein [Nostoc commune]|uniref:hypothetical protein n=1 Tax=Nostoc commune TaxID=1178 RepID=UPI001E53E76D|nr:hypothetical protein [Nostoc commune]